MKQSNTEQPRQAASQAARERWECVKRDAPIYWKAFREWSRIHGRRVAHQIHNVVAGNRAAGPVSFLVCSAALAVALTLTTLYAPSYAVTLDGEPVGVVTDEGMVQKAIQSVEAVSYTHLDVYKRQLRPSAWPSRPPWSPPPT